MEWDKIQCTWHLCGQPEPDHVAVMSQDSHVSDLSSEGRQRGQACCHLNHLRFREDGCSGRHAISGFGDKASGARIVVHLNKRYDAINV